MDRETEYLTLDMIIEMQKVIIDRVGGIHGIRDMGGLASAVEQPKATFGGVDLYSSLGEKITALGFSLISNHAFLDGNKRIGHVAMRVFGELNGYALIVPHDEQEKVILSVAAGEMEREPFTAWIISHLQPLSG